jgi:hypothetical protein
MNRANPRLIILAAVTLAITLAVKVVPSLVAGYSDLKGERENLRQELTYYEKLVDDETELKARAEEARMLVTGIEDSVFYIPENLIGSEIQAIIRNASVSTGVEVREMRVAKVETFEDWIKVSQDLNFVIEQNRILPFLNALKAYRPRLYVRKFTISRSRQQFIGALTIEAFSRHPGDFE